jgi:solute carrier family 25 phosphate transporter 3
MKREGVKGLVRGWAPTLVGYSIQGLCKFGFYEFFKHKYSVFVGQDIAYRYRDIVYMCASASAEFIADIGLCPFEAVKVRVQTNPSFGRGLSDGLPKIWNGEGFQGLYKGIVPLWARQIPYTIIKFVAFERVVEFFYKCLPKKKHEYTKTEQLGVTFASGYIAGVICGAVSHPADTMVSKLNKAKGDDGLGAASRKIYYGTPEEPGIGFKGLWKGFAPRVFMIGTLTGLQWFIYDSFKVYSGLPTTGGVAKK